MYTNRVFGTAKCVLFIEVSSFQGVLIIEVASFQGVLIRGVPPYVQLMWSKHRIGNRHKTQDQHIDLLD